MLRSRFRYRLNRCQRIDASEDRRSVVLAAEGLDEEHIDLAMESVGRLVSEVADRLILVVSHVSGLRGRLEGLIVLAKDEVTGDTTARSGSAAPA